jgi:hypothetical protein
VRRVTAEEQASTYLEWVTNERSFMEFVVIVAFRGVKYAMGVGCSEYILMEL